MAAQPVKQQRNRPSAQPLLTIALPVYNGAATLELAIRSILLQSFTDWEMIILDDASTDDSRAVMRSFQDSRICLVEGDKNIGLSARLNMAVDMAEGRYFARMDQDDISFPDRLEKQLDYLQKHPGIDLLATSTIPFRGDGEALGRLPVASEHEQICARPWNGFHLPHPTWMGKTDWFRQHRYESVADGAEDQQLLLRTYRLSRFACLQEPLLAYREGDRPLKKMLRARRIFARAYMRVFFFERNYGMVIRMGLLLLLKVAADILHACVGSDRLRNTLLPLSSAQQTAWLKLWSVLMENSAGDAVAEA